MPAAPDPRRGIARFCAGPQDPRDPVLKPLLCILATVGCVACVPLGQPAPAGETRTFPVATAPGVSLEVVDWGGSGRVMVFLAGGGHTARQFDRFAPLFAQEYRVLGISRRGSGGSSDVPPDSLAELAQDVVAVLDSLDVGSAVLVGHSFGGVEMALLAETHPDRCAGLVFLDAGYDYTDPEIARIFTESPPHPHTAGVAGPFLVPRAGCGRARARRGVRDRLQPVDRGAAGKVRRRHGEPGGGIPQQQPLLLPREPGRSAAHHSRLRVFAPLIAEPAPQSSRGWGRDRGASRPPAARLHRPQLRSGGADRLSPVDSLHGRLPRCGPTLRRGHRPARGG